MLDISVSNLFKHAHLNWAVLDQVVVSGANFLTGIFLARFLGLEGFGTFTLVWALYLFSYAIQEGLIISPMMSIGPKLAENEQSLYFGALFTHALIYALAAALLLSVFLLIGEDFGIGSSKYIWALFWVSFFRLLQDFVRRYFFVLEKPQIALLLDVVCYLGQLGIVGYMLYGELGNIEWVLYTHALTAALSLLSAFFFLGPLKFSLTAVKSWAKRNWASSRWLTLSELAEWATNYAFIATAGVVIGVAAVGVIRAAQNIMGISHIFLLGMENVLPAKASKHYIKHGWGGLMAFSRKTGMLIVGFMLLFILITSLFPGFWLNLFYGAEYKSYGFAVIWMGGIYLMLAIVTPIRIILRTAENTRPVFASFFLTALLSLVFAYPMSVIGGLNGILAGMLLVASVRPFLLWRGVTQTRDRIANTATVELAGG